MQAVFNLEALVQANEERTARAARDNVMRARKALSILRSNQPECISHGKHRGYENHKAALQARVKHPHASLAEIAAARGQTKDSYSSALRRAFVYAEQLKYVQQ